MPIRNNINIFLDYLDEMIPNPVCELNYKKDYELLIAVMLSAQSTDKTVNKVTEKLFSEYKTLKEIANSELEDLKKIIRPCGSYNKKSVYTKEIAKTLVNEYNSKVPNNRELLESLPGIGRKTTNVIFSELFHIPAIAVDTHVMRVSKRLEIAKESDNPNEIEQKLMKLIPVENWNKVHYQIVLFGRYHCKAKKPNCENCKLNNKFCKWKKGDNNEK